MKKRHPTILVIEDDPNDQFMIRRGFGEIEVSATVHVVNNGLEALAYIKGEGEFADRNKYTYPTFVMTDLKMPGADGFAVLDFLRNHPDWSVIPTIVLSGSSDLDDIKKAYMLGASSYHVKPGTFKALTHQLQVLYAYWMTCQVPMVDSTGRKMHTDSRGKLGERFPQQDDPNAQLE